MKLFHFLAVSFCALFFVSCNPNSDDLCDGAPVFDAELFATYISEAMNSNFSPTVGYQFAIAQNGDVVHSEWGGYAIHPSDLNGGGPNGLGMGGVVWTEDMPMNIASVSKMFGAAVMLRVLNDEGIDPHDPILPYLPQTWQDTTLHPDLFTPGSPKELTFAKLMLHQTAINRYNAAGEVIHGSMPSEEEMLQALMAPPTTGNGYKNINFTLLRVLIVEMVYGLDETAPDYATLCTDLYYTFLRGYFFEPIELDCRASEAEFQAVLESNERTWAYQQPFNPGFRDGENHLGWEYGNIYAYKNAGSGGMTMTATEIVQFMSALRQTTTILSDQGSDMLFNEYGLDASRDGDYGRYQAKGGTKGPDNSASSRALRSMAMFFPNGVEAVLLTNSNHDNLSEILQVGYDFAWVDCN